MRIGEGISALIMDFAIVVTLSVATKVHECEAYGCCRWDILVSSLIYKVTHFII